MARALSQELPVSLIIVNIYVAAYLPHVSAVA